jgi:hypothetical protein
VIVVHNHPGELPCLVGRRGDHKAIHRREWQGYRLTWHVRNMTTAYCPGKRLTREIGVGTTRHQFVAGGMMTFVFVRRRARSFLVPRRCAPFWRNKMREIGKLGPNPVFPAATEAGLVL